MPSAPDYEAAHRLNPDRFPKDPMKQAAEAQQQLSYVAELLAAATGKTKAKVLEEARRATQSGSAPQVAPREGTEQAAVKRVERDRAQFFGHVERSSFYPVKALDTAEFADVDQKMLRYFETAEEAEANGFTRAEDVDSSADADSETSDDGDVAEGDSGRTAEEAEAKPKKGKAGKKK